MYAIRSYYDDKSVTTRVPGGYIEKTVSTLPKLGDFRSNIREIEISYLKRALDESDSNQKLAAEKLSLTYDQFRGLFRKYRKEL